MGKSFQDLCRDMQASPIIYHHSIAFEIPTDSYYHSPNSESIQKDICQALEHQMHVPDYIKGLQYLSEKVILLTLDSKKEYPEYFKILLIQYFHNKFCDSGKVVKIFHPKLVGHSKVEAVVTGIPLPVAEEGFLDIQKQIPRKFPYLTDVKAKFIKMKNQGTNAGDILVQANTDDLIQVHCDLCPGRSLSFQSHKGTIRYKSSDQMKKLS
ncbi:uncharacterized protein [Palaemon carinicauda]